MKRVMILCVAVLMGGMFTACEKDDKGQLDPNAMISLRPAEGVKAAAANTQHLTAKEIVKKTSIISFWSPINGHTNANERGFDKAQRDFVNNRLLMAGTDVIDALGHLEPAFIEGYDILFVVFDDRNHPVDTIAYIPNAVVRKAEKEIKAAYANDDYTACYALFDRAFTFVPITGDEWRALKAEDKN